MQNLVLQHANEEEEEEEDELRRRMIYLTVNAILYFIPFAWVGLVSQLLVGLLLLAKC